MDNKNNTSYITIDLCGGLGNQLFQIGMVYCLAWKYNKIPMILKIDSSPSVFNNRPVYWDTIFSKLNYVDKSFYNSVALEKLDENRRLKEYNLQSNKSYILHGYFQYPFYLDIYREKLLELFSLPSEIMDKIKNKYTSINKKSCKTVAVHVRRGDYLKLQHYHIVQPVSYYNNAISSFSQDNLFIVFSDDIEWCRDNIKANNIYFVTSQDKIDNLPQDVFELFLMSMCNHFIISNSSFSWWSYWLSTNKDKKIIYPSEWFTNKSKNDNYLKLLFNK
jgi:hypothetical protein